jgi:hypothetical protein
VARVSEPNIDDEKCHGRDRVDDSEAASRA